MINKFICFRVSIGIMIMKRKRRKVVAVVVMEVLLTIIC